MSFLAARFAGLTLVALVACGGATETVPASTGSGEPTGEAPPAELPPSSPAPPPPAAPAPAPALPAVAKVADPPGAGSTPFHLVVSNRAADAMGVDVFVDATKVVTGGVPPTSKHVFDFALEDGAHTVEVKAAESPRSLPAEKSVAFELSGARWGVVDLSTVRCDPCSPAIIGWELRESAP